MMLDSGILLMKIDGVTYFSSLFIPIFSFYFIFPPFFRQREIIPYRKDHRISNTLKNCFCRVMRRNENNKILSDLKLNE